MFHCLIGPFLESTCLQVRNIDSQWRASGGRSGQKHVSFFGEGTGIVKLNDGDALTTRSSIVRELSRVLDFHVADSEGNDDRAVILVQVGGPPLHRESTVGSNLQAPGARVADPVGGLHREILSITSEGKIEIAARRHGASSAGLMGRGSAHRVLEARMRFAPTVCALQDATKDEAVWLEAVRVHVREVVRGGVEERHL